jgi:8-oxo-dGTP pyrophosphatase MutT (NUDIX family)
VGHGPGNGMLAGRAGDSFTRSGDPGQNAAMPVLRSFGTPPPAGVACRPRRGAYAVIRGEGGRVAAVNDDGRFYLPGGGSLEHETPEATVVREVAEELGRHVEDLRPLGEAEQYFHSHNDRCWYRMHATLFTARLRGEAFEPREFETEWLAATRTAQRFFYECHEWAVALAAEDGSGG